VVREDFLCSLEDSFKEHCLLSIDEVKLVPTGTISSDKILIGKRKWD
jgi:hypothetical protein